MLLAVVAVCTAVTVANIYLAAPLLPLIAHGFGSEPSALAWLASVSLLGYAAGLLFFAPLGDTADRRRLVGILSAVAALAMGAAAVCPGPVALACALFVAAAASVIPQLLVPLVAERAPADRRARHVAAVIAGLFAGVVAARVLGGLVAQAHGWRVVFVGAAALTLVLGLVTAALLPAETRPRHSGPALAGLARLPQVLKESPELRRACLRQGGMYGAWSAVWTSLALLLTSDAYDMSTGAAGLFGLLGLSATVVAPLAGGLVDRFGAARVTATAYAGAAVCLPLFWLGGRQLWALCAAGILIHAALVASHVANQTLALTATSLPATANTAYVVGGFASGALASALAGTAFTHGGWGGVCVIATVWLALGWVTAIRRST
ncbi:MFS transporter [Streptomyces sp. NPDC021622]|uniref:MFS transporter n=1 Tax=Streptomyces sp. NPDC021622 TaxID=3155013 RepID=UPI0033E1232C